MLSKLIITLENDCKLNQNVGSVMQGVLMEHLDEKLASELHIGGVNPYSQYLKIQKDNAEWHIATLNNEMRENILLPLLYSKEQEFNLKQRDTKLKILKKELVNMSYDQLTEQTYLGQCRPYLTLDFISPTAFKVDGKYQFYPTPFHIFQSLVRKYDAVCKDTEIFSEELMREIKEDITVSRYNLRSCSFGLEGVKIPAFKGQISMRIHGPQMFVNLIHMLAVFGTYSGIGIKTAMGMGAVSVLE